jgi:lysyl-tRNA synthetase, class II
VFFESETVALTGRVMSIRSAGAKLIFIDIVGDDNKVQVLASADTYQGDFEEIHHRVKRGDIIGVQGVPGRTQRGELSVKPTSIVSLSYCLHMLPSQHDVETHGLTKDTKYR